MATYYIDPVNGNDASAGTSWGTAKKTPYGLRNTPPVITLAVGDIVKFPKNTSKEDLTPTLTTASFSATSGTLSQSIDVFNPFDTWASTGEFIAANTATVSTTTGSNKGPSLSYGSVTTPAAPANNTKYAYLHKTAWATTPLDFSAYQEIHLYTSINTTGVTWTDGMYRLCLCSDIAGDVIVNDLPIQCTNATTGAVWYASFCFNGGSNLGSSIKSIALYSGTGSNIGASKQFRIMAIVAQKTNPVIRYGDVLIIDEANKGPVFILDGAIQNGTSASPTIWFNAQEGTASFGKQLTAAPLKRIRPVFRKTSDPDWPGTGCAWMGTNVPSGTDWNNNITFSGGWDTSSGLQDGYTYFGDNFSSAYVIGGSRASSELGWYAMEKFVTTRKNMTYFGPPTSPAGIYVKFTDCYSGSLYVAGTGTANYMMYWGTTATGFAYKMYGGWLGGMAAGQSVYGASWNYSYLNGTVVTGNPNVGSSQTVEWVDAYLYGSGQYSLSDPGYLTITNLYMYGRILSLNPTNTGSTPLSVAIDNVDLYNGAGLRVATTTNAGLAGYAGINGTINDVQNFGTYTTAQDALSVGHPTFKADSAVITVTNAVLTGCQLLVGQNCRLTNITMAGGALLKSGLNASIGRTVIDNLQFTSAQAAGVSTSWEGFIFKNSTLWLANSEVNYPNLYSCEFHNCTIRNTTPGTNNAALAVYRTNWTNPTFVDTTFDGVYLQADFPTSYGPYRTDIVLRNCTFLNQSVSTGDILLNQSGDVMPRILAVDVTWHRGPLIGQYSFGGDTAYFDLAYAHVNQTANFFRWNKNATDHRIYNFNGIIQTQTDFVHTPGNVAWKFTRHSYSNKYTADDKQFNHTLARIVVKESVACHLRLWVYNNNSAQKLHLMVPGRQISPTQAELIATSTGFQVWEELHVNFTPDVSGVIEVLLGWTYPHALVAAVSYWDDFSVAET